jgi:hypothetical protein
MGLDSCLAFYSVLSTSYSALPFLPCRSNSPSTAAAPPPAAANTGELLRQNQPFGLFAAVVKSFNCRFCKKYFSHLQNFLTEGNACGMTEGRLIFCFKLKTMDYQSFQQFQRIEGKSVTINVG